MQGKQGVSAIIVTVIIVGLALVAAGVVWAVINNIIGTKVESADLNSKCLDVDVKATATTCDATECDVSLSRGVGSVSIDGVKLIFYEGNTQGNVQTVAGNIAILGTATAADQAHGLTTPDKVGVRAYFTDSAGTEQICSQEKPYS